MATFSSKEKCFLWGCIFVCVVSIFFNFKFFPKVFPEAKIKFEVTQQKAKELSKKFLKEMEIEGLEKYKHSTIFDYDEMTKIFLERELEEEERDEIMGKKVKLWKWVNRYFKSLQKEEFKVEITPEGEIVGFSHIIEEEKEGEKLEEDSAKTLAEKFIKEKIKMKLEELEFLEGKTEIKPKRIDYTFTWKKFDLNDAEYRVEVKIQGEKVGSYREYLKIPEKWEREYKRMRSLNTTTTIVTYLITMLIIGIGMVVTFVFMWRHKDIRWRIPVIISIIGGVIYLLASLNYIEITIFSYDTTESYSSFLAKHISLSMMGAGILGVLLLFVTSTGETVYRENYKNKIAFQYLFSLKGLKTKTFFYGLVVGVTLACVFVVYEIVFYLLAKKLGAWAPLGVSYNNILNTKIPWIYPLFVGFYPAISEEFMFRVFGVPFFKKLTRSTVIAILLPSILWGFLHTGYPQQPFFIRGIEVSIMGIIFSIIMTKLNPFPLMVTHYSLNAVLTALILIKSGHPYFLLSGIIVAGITIFPIVWGLIFYSKNKGFVKEEELTNEKVGIRRREEKYIEEKKIIPPYLPSLSLRKIILPTIVLIVLAGVFLNQNKRTKFIKYLLPKKEIEKIAEKWMKERKVKVEEYEKVLSTTSYADHYVTKYVAEEKGEIGLKKVYKNWLPVEGWKVRYFKFLEKEEYRVEIHPEKGEVVYFNHIIPEEKEGEDLTKEEARRIGVEYLMKKGVDTSFYEIKEIKPFKRKNRRDYKLVWEQRRGIKEAKKRMVVHIKGEEVAGFSEYVKIPEKWERKRKEKKLIHTGMRILKVGILLFLIVVGGILFFKKIQLQKIKWKIGVIIGGIVGVLFLVDEVLNFHLKWDDYSTSISQNVFLLTTISTSIFMVVFTILGALVFSSFILAFYPEAEAITLKEGRRLWSKEGIIGGVFFASGLIMIDNLFDYLRIKLPKFTPTIYLPFSEEVEKIFPFISWVGNTLMDVLLWGAGIGLFVYLWKTYCKKLVIRVVFLLGVFLLLLNVDGVQTIKETTLPLIEAGMKVLFVIGSIKWVLRKNYLGYIVGVYLLKNVNILGSSLTEPILLWNNVLFIVFAFLLPFGLILWEMKNSPKNNKKLITT